MTVDESAVAVPPPKAQADTLTLRARPRRVVRFRRSLLIGAAAGGSLALAGLAWLSLGGHRLHIAASPDVQPVSERRVPTDAVASLPDSYSRVTPSTPILSPPLPGDLGRPILERQRELAAEGGVTGQTEAAEPGQLPPAPTPAAQAAEAERLRRADQARAAREAGVMVQSASRNKSPSVATASADDTALPVPPIASAGDMPSAGIGTAPNSQQPKHNFLNQRADTTLNPHRLEAPASPWMVMAGSSIAASLITGLNSDLPGMVVAQVTESVFDTATGRFLLVPQGSRLIGRYDSVVAFGQSRALLVWQRIILPDGSSIQLDNLPATDAAGYTGLADKVDFHTWRLLKGVALSTLLGVGTQVSIGGDGDLVRAIREATQQSASQVGQQVVTKQLAVQPTIRIRPGWPVRVLVHKDLILRPWGGR